MSKDIAISLENLRLEVRDIARELEDSDCVKADRLKDAADLLRVLAQITKGKDLRSAFGSPGDWGYDTPIGRGVLFLHQRPV